MRSLHTMIESPLHRTTAEAYLFFVAMDIEVDFASRVCVAWSKLIDFENSIFDRPTQQFNKRKNAIKRLFWELKGFAFFFFFEGGESSSLQIGFTAATAAVSMTPKWEWEVCFAENFVSQTCV